MPRTKILIILILLIIIHPPKRVWAASESECKKLKILEWQEARSQFFIFISPMEGSQIAQDLYQVYAPSLDQEYNRFSALFEEDLDLPITIQIYPNVLYFDCLNVQAPVLGNDEFVSHIGAREISFIENLIPPDLYTLKDSLLNNFRAELAHLFLDRVTDANAPPGLVAGVKLYAQDPGWLFESADFASTGYSTPGQSWRHIWENESSATNPALKQDAVSIVAYLVDTYGWQELLSFLKDMATTMGYRQSLIDTYGIEFSKMQDQWEQYYPLYFQGRWQSHAFYAFDLTGIEKLIQNGAYTDAIQSLKKAISFLEETPQMDKLQQAQKLLYLARTGEEASNLVMETRLALQSAEFQLSIELANQALLKYEEIGDNRRQEEIELYREKAQQALNLRAEAETLQQQLDTVSDPKTLAAQLANVGERLASLGDQQALASINQSLTQLNTVQQSKNEKTRTQAIIGVLILLSLRLLYLILKPRKEVL